jgi:hypothetical protein
MAGGSGFNRERFLLRGVAVIVSSQLLFYGLTVAACFHYHQQRPACTDVAAQLENTFEGALSTALALLGGSSLPRHRGPGPGP